MYTYPNYSIIFKEEDKHVSCLFLTQFICGFHSVLNGPSLKRRSMLHEIFDTKMCMTYIKSSALTVSNLFFLKHHLSKNHLGFYRTPLLHTNCHSIPNTERIPIRNQDTMLLFFHFSIVATSLWFGVSDTQDKVQKIDTYPQKVRVVHFSETRPCHPREIQYSITNPLCKNM